MVAGQVLGGPTAAEVADGVGGDRRQTLLAVAFGVLDEDLAEAVPLLVVQDPGHLGQLVDDLLLGLIHAGLRRWVCALAIGVGQAHEHC